MRFLTDWKDSRKVEMAKMTDKIKRQSYGQENCMVCNKVFIKYHNCSKICSDECKIIRQREYEHEWRKRNSNYTKKNRKRINATQRRSYYKSKKDPEWVKKRNKRQEEWHRKKTEKEKEMIKMTDKKYKLTLEEFKSIQQRKAKGSSWSAIRDDMFYTYTEGYLITISDLSRQYYQLKYKQDDPTNPTKGAWIDSETKALISMFNTGIPRKHMMPALNRTYSQIASKINNLKKAGKVVGDDIRERNAREVRALPTSIIERRAMMFHGPYSTVPIGNVDVLEEKSKQVIADVKEMLKETPPPEIHNTDLKIKQGNPTIVDDEGNQLNRVSQDIVEQCQYICDLLLAKNKQYGNSVSEPVRIFSKADTSEQIKVRIDDKISRLIRGDDSLEPDEDIVDDLIGYLILLKIQMNK